MSMNRAQREKGAQQLTTFIEQILDGKVDWFAITVKYPGVTLAIHTEGAPKRPRGIS